MIDEAAVLTSARELLSDVIGPRIGQELVITSVTEHPYCWVVTYNTKRFGETGEKRYALAGNGPLIVNKTGNLRQGVSG